jgi:hypothetical protein
MPRCALNRANAGAELCPGMMPDPLRMAFYVRRLASHAKEWWSDLVDAKTVMEEFAEGGQVPRESLFNTCQAMSLLENRLRVDDSKFDPVRLDRSVTRELLAIWDNLDAQELLAPRSLAVLHPRLARAGTLPTSTANLSVDGTLIDVKTVETPIVERVFMRQLVGKAAQAQLGSVQPKGDAPGKVAVDRIAFLFTRQKRLIEFGIEELFGAEGWERSLDGFAELAGIEREREMAHADGMSMAM